MKRYGRRIGIVFLFILLVAGVVFSFPKILAWTIVRQEQKQILAKATEQFPVTVDPKNKIINENEQVNAFLADNHSLFGAAVANTGNALWNIFEEIAIGLAHAPWYQNIASASGRFVTITPGLRKEQVASAFATTLSWNSKQKKEFTALSLSEGSFAPGVYFVPLGTTPEAVQTMVNERFFEEVLSHYGTSTREILPLNDALIIASLIQRETAGTDGMRLVSGIMWNRLFANMKLQVDATLQYAKANSRAGGTWWPDVAPADKYIKSPYNTYLHEGLPPAPIANPSVAAILAALNPIETPCLYYFNDKAGDFHCSRTYAEHTKLLKKYYGN
jgi:uncharacterized YceG family protein